LGGLGHSRAGALLFSPLLGADNGWTWVLSIMFLTVVIRIALIPLFVKQIKSSRNMQLLQPKVRELQKQNMVMTGRSSVRKP
jgi:membrane protein insertase Oxa1/YidC/SpoIIIJ